jgi:hypothetical protein
VNGTQDSPIPALFLTSLVDLCFDYFSTEVPQNLKAQSPFTNEEEQVVFARDVLLCPKWWCSSLFQMAQSKSTNQ